MNATKVVVDGVKFDSRLESWFYGRLKMFGIAFEHQKTYVLQPKFRFLNENIRAIEIVVDFYLPGPNVIIDTKGWQTADNKIKIKMLKYHLVNSDHYCNPPQIFLPSSQKECDAILLKLNIIK